MTNLVDLPTEMKVRILSSLPPRKIQLLRAVSRCFHQTVDINEYQLVIPHQTQALSHIKSELDTALPATNKKNNDEKHINTEDNTESEDKAGFLEYLDQTLTRRGLWLHWQMMSRILFEMVHLWTFQNFGIATNREERTPEQQGLFIRLAAVAHELVHLHLQTHLNTHFHDYERGIYGEAAYRRCADEIMELTNEAELVLKTELVCRWRSTIAEMPEAYFKACVQDPMQTTQPLQLTNLRYYHIIDA